MKKTAVGIPLVLCLLGACVPLAFVIDKVAHGWQETTEASDDEGDDGGSAESAAADDGGGVGATFRGATNCATCHLSVPLEFRKDTNFIYFNEFEMWISEDKHSRSLLRIIPDEELFNERNVEFNALLAFVEGRGIKKPAAETFGESNKLSSQICETLEIDPKNFLNERQCLSCHANWRAEDEQPDKDVMEFAVGVSCESCHGAASEWLDPHQKKDPWRKTSPEEKHATTGMVNVRNPAVRARQCYSCHVGNPEQGKVVTHEMYAAGHPPLPSIEIETFANEMPRHWRYLEEKSDFDFREEFEKAHTTWKNDLSSSKAVILGGVSARRDFMTLLSNQANSYMSRMKKEGDGANLTPEESRIVWPQFAMYDCAMCHHELRDEEFRKDARVPDLRPGRPWTHRWPQALVDVAIAHAGKPEGYDDGVDALTAAMNAAPFGNPTVLPGDATSKLADSLTALSEAVQNKEFQVEHAMIALKTLCDSDKPIIVDYNSARQVAWAIRTIYQDVKRAEAKLKEADDAYEPKLTAAMIAVFDEELRALKKADPEKGTDEVPAGLLYAKLKLKLPSKVQGRSITENRKTFMDSMEFYQPDEVAPHLTRLSNALGGGAE